MSLLRISRRSFLSLPAFAPLVRMGFAANVEETEGHHYFAYDYVIGTSLDLDVWTPDSAAARRAETAVLDEVHRLASILNTRDPGSEISRRLHPFDVRSVRDLSPELAEVVALYAYWKEQTGGVLSLQPLGPGSPVNVDALGMAYIIDRAAAAAMAAAPELEGLQLNIGGDIVVRVRRCRTRTPP